MRFANSTQFPQEANIGNSFAGKWLLLLLSA